MLYTLLATVFIMNNFILYTMIIGWIIGVLIALMILIYTFVKRDKDGFKTGIYLAIIFGLTGYITFFPITIASLISYRFSNCG